MKKTAFIIMATFLSLSFIPLESNAVNIKVPITEETTKAQESQQAKLLTLRLTEIKEMDKSDLTTTEKKALRKEVRNIEKELTELGDGMYISLGAAIIILLLLIIIL